MKRITITGGSGFIGQNIAALLLEKSYEVCIVDSRPPLIGRFVEADLMSEGLPTEPFEGAESVIHLAGETIFGRWNERKKKAIRKSRTLGTRNLVSTLKRLKQPPASFVCASAVGFYGERGDEELFETSPPGKDFLAHVCIDWENEASQAHDIGIRTVMMRTAPVLGEKGLLQKVLPVYRMGLGGPLGSGTQWFPWIHIRDIAQIYVFAIEHKKIEGPCNACAPEYITNQDFSDALARVLRRPALVKVPKWALRLALGELADSIVASQKVSPKKLIDAGYEFSFPDLEKALVHLLKK